MYSGLAESRLHDEVYEHVDDTVHIKRVRCVLENQFIWETFADVVGQCNEVERSLHQKKRRHDDDERTHGLPRRVGPGGGSGGVRGSCDAHGQDADAPMVTMHDAQDEARCYDDSDKLDEEEAYCVHGDDEYGIYWVAE